MKHIVQDFSISSMTAGFVAVLVGFASAAVLVFQAAAAAGASQAEVSSWIFALGIGSGLTTIGLSLYYKMPILTAWSTPGAALLATSIGHHSLAQCLGAFVVSSLLIFLVGITGIFEKIMNKIPKALTSAMLAGIVFHFGVSAFSAMQNQFALVASMFVLYLLGKRYFPRYVILSVLISGVLIAHYLNLLHFEHFSWTLSYPVFVMPEWDNSAILGIALPLFIVTMTSQNIPGFSVLKSSGYNPPVSPLMSITGLFNALIAPFGGFALNLAAITAAICMSPDAAKDPNKRYTAALFAGFIYFVQALLGATLVGLFASFPQELTLGLAGLALLPTLGSSMQTALAEEKQRESAMITFVVTASGVSLFGLGAPLWGLLAGILALFIFKAKPLTFFTRPLVD